MLSSPLPHRDLGRKAAHYQTHKQTRFCSSRHSCQRMSQRKHVPSLLFSFAKMLLERETRGGTAALSRSCDLTRRESGAIKTENLCARQECSTLMNTAI